AKAAYRTFGSPSNPAILLPSCYGGKLESTLPFLYRSDAPNVASNSVVLPPERYFIIVVGLLGGSESSSPSNTAAPFNGPNFPHTTYEDNMRLQRALCEHLGVSKLFGYIGFSMGGQQAYHMASLFPDFVDNSICIAGSARTSWHNWSFLEGPKAALVNSVDFQDGNYSTKVVRGTGAFGRVYSTWALSQQWFREKSWEKIGFATLQDYLRENWEKRMGDWDAHDLLCLLRTWQMGDITIYHAEDNGDLAKALARIKARMLVMPSRTDTYFPPEDSMQEVKHLKAGKLSVIESIWGHIAGGGGGTKEDCKFIENQVKEFLEDP
ncbi:alpha/beta-hydrolase, partial [Rhizodiscina lignyota]